MKNRLKYLVHYDTSDKEGRTYCLSAKSKVDYICQTLVKIGYEVEIISASTVSAKGYFKGGSEHLGGHRTLKRFPAFKWGNPLEKLLAYAWGQLIIFLYLVFCIRRDETLLVYHSLALTRSVSFAYRLRHFRLILEVEELYTDVVKRDAEKKARELRSIRFADAYIFPAILLNEKINAENRPYCIIHGTYQVEPSREVSFGDGKIHVVYAGTFDPRKGAAAAAAAAAHLPTGYHIHILGFGSTKETELLKRRIEEINRVSKAEVSYDGLFSGEEYIRFLQKCQIGLSTQNPNAEFNETSFPSKILSYMANGLRVVTVRIPAIEGSAIGKDVYYYDIQTPEGIAEAIMEVDFEKSYDGRSRVAELDIQFQENLKNLLENEI